MTDADTQPSISHPPVTVRQILRFYTPLVLTSQLMTLSGPVVNVAIGRAIDPKLDFAAFWIAFTIVLFIESGSLATQQATLAISEGSESLRRLAKSAFAVGVSATNRCVARGPHAPRRPGIHAHHPHHGARGGSVPERRC